MSDAPHVILHKDPLKLLIKTPKRPKKMKQENDRHHQLEEGQVMQFDQPHTAVNPYYPTEGTPYATEQGSYPQQYPSFDYQPGYDHPGPGAYQPHSQPQLHPNSTTLNSVPSSGLSGAFRDCGDIIDALINHSYGHIFSEPVDYIKLGIPTYPDIVKNPMDLGSIRRNLGTPGIYQNVQQFDADVRLVWYNAMLFNPPENTVHIMARELSSLYENYMIERNLKPFHPEEPELPVPPVPELIDPDQNNIGGKLKFDSQSQVTTATAPITTSSFSHYPQASVVDLTDTGDFSSPPPLTSAIPPLSQASFQPSTSSAVSSSTPRIPVVTFRDQQLVEEKHNVVPEEPPMSQKELKDLAKDFNELQGEYLTSVILTFRQYCPDLVKNGASINLNNLPPYVCRILDRSVKRHLGKQKCMDEAVYKPEKKIKKKKKKEPTDFDPNFMWGRII